MSKGELLVELDNKIRRCLDDGLLHRNKLISMTGFVGIDGLAGLADPLASADLQSEFAQFQLCAARAKELRDEKLRIARA